MLDVKEIYKIIKENYIEEKIEPDNSDDYDNNDNDDYDNDDYDDDDYDDDDFLTEIERALCPCDD